MMSKWIVGLALVSIVGCVVGCAAPEGEEEGAVGTVGQAQTTGPAFYVDGVLYRTVGTPTDFSGAGAPESSFDVIYSFRGAQRYNVSTVGPGTPGYNGGRWRVHAVSFANYDAALAKHDANDSGDFDSDEEVKAALAAGDAVDTGIIKTFECPVIPLPKSDR
jgi:hypothetical protein